jgi:hypothetical protein
VRGGRYGIKPPRTQLALMKESTQLNKEKS